MRCISAIDNRRVQPDDALELEAELELGDLVARDAGGVGGAYARGRAPRDARARHLHVFAGASFGRGRSGRGLVPHCPLRSGVGSGERGGLEFEPAGHRDLARRSPRRKRSLRSTPSHSEPCTWKP